MPGPRNSKKAKKQTEKDKARRTQNALKDVKQNVPDERPICPLEEVLKPITETLSSDSGTAQTENARNNSEATCSPDSRGIIDSSRSEHPNTYRTDPPPALALPGSSFIANPGNGPRVKDMESFLSSFFCPSVSREDEGCALFAPKEVLTVLEAVLPREVALIVWYNKTRSYDRVCPACQRLYRLGDSLVDPISGELVDINDPRTPPYVIREQQLSGICSFPCFFLASYSSHPYTAEVASGAWGFLFDELDAHARSLLDATDPSTAAMLRYGFSAWSPSLTDEQGNDRFGDQGLGRVMRMTRRKDLGLGEVLEALAWYEEERRPTGIALGNPPEKEQCRMPDISVEVQREK